MKIFSRLFFISSLSCLLILSFASSCKKDEDLSVVDPAPNPPYVPATYNFENVNYSGQIYRIAMLDEISNYMSTSNTSGVSLSAVKLKEMYSNSNSQFSDSTLNNCGKQLKNKTFSLDQTLFDAYFDTLALVSTSSSAGSIGVNGVVVSTTDPSKKYLQAANGIEYAQVIKKGLMGAVFYYQAMEVYLPALATDDNTTVVPGEGTVMAHHFDEAFGYFGAPIDFPGNLISLKYWASYSNQVNPSLTSNSLMMNAFLSARAAIVRSDYATRDAKVLTIRQQWEKIVAASVIRELNLAKANLSDNAIRNHYVSEAIGFVLSLKYNSQKLITDAQIAQVQDFIGYNIYSITVSDIDNARNLISTVYGLDAVKDAL